MGKITEGKAIIKHNHTGKVTRSMDVFYNPVMKHNRDIAVLLLKALGREKMKIGLPMEASGIRGIRFMKELEKGTIEALHMNDHNIKAVKAMRINLKLNKINSFTTIKNNQKKAAKEVPFALSNQDANLFLLNSKGYEYIDIDPFGTSNPFLDAAIKRIARNGILAVTNTDTAALAGSLPSVCKRLYWAVPKKDYCMHETGLRILIRKIQLVGMQYDKALIPLYSYFKDHYFRAYFLCIKGKRQCDDIVAKHGFFDGAGPLWLGQLWDHNVAKKMAGFATRTAMNNADKELARFLEIIADESRLLAVGFVDLHALNFKLKRIPKKDVIIKKLQIKGYAAASTHFKGEGIRTNAPISEIERL